MHDIKSIRDDPAAFDAALKRRGLEPLAAHIISIDERRRAIIRVLEVNQARRNAASKEVGEVKRAKDDARAAVLTAEVTQLKESISTLTAEEKDASKELETTLAAIPNLPLDDVPDGTDEHGNVQHHVFGAVRNYAFPPKSHDDLGEAMGFMDFKTAAKLSGARFVVLKKGLARLERAIGQFMLDLHTNEHGYTEVNPPLLVRDAAMFGTGQLPKFEDDQYFVGNPAVERLQNYKIARSSAVAQIEEADARIALFESKSSLPFSSPDVPPDIPILNAKRDNLSTIVLQLDRDIAFLEKRVDSIRGK